MTAHNRATRRTVIGAVLGLVLGLAGVLSPAAAADVRDPILRKDLALIAEQLERIEQVIDRLAARQRQLPDKRVILDVWQLRADINDIQTGIRDYLAPARLPPRQLAPLSGDYLEQNAGDAGASP